MAKIVHTGDGPTHPQWRDAQRSAVTLFAPASLLDALSPGQVGWAPNQHDAHLSAGEDVNRAAWAQYAAGITY